MTLRITFTDLDKITLDTEKDHLLKPQREKVIIIILRQWHQKEIKEEKPLRDIKMNKREKRFELINCNHSNKKIT